MDDEIKISNYLKVIKKNWLLIIVLFLIISGATIIYTYNQKPIYEATSLVMVPIQDKTSLILGKSSPRNDITTEIEIIKSEAVLGEIISKFGSDFKIDVESRGKSNVIEISVESTDPNASKMIANNLAEEYVFYSTNSAKIQAQEINIIMDHQLNQYGDDIKSLNEKILEFKMHSNSTNLTNSYIFNNLKDEIRAKENLQNYLLSRKEEVSMISNIGGANRKIIEYAKLPAMPIKPIIPLNIGIGLMLGIIGSFGIAYTKEHLKRTFNNHNDIESEIGQIIGTVPKLKNIKKENYSNFLTRLFCLLRPRIFQVRNDYHFYQHLAPNNRFAENIRMLRTNLLFYAKEKNAKIISITSPQSNDGKSTIASNLAMALAKNNIKVLLVDSNLRNPTLVKFFKKSFMDKQGLREVILGKTFIHDVIKETGQKKLDVILADKKPGQPSELLSSNKMKSILKELKEMDYDIILIDNSSTEFSETSFISANSDGVILVIADDVTKKEKAYLSKSILEKVNANLIGVVVNLA